MDPMTFMGLLGQAQGGDPETTGATRAPQALPTGQLPASTFDPNSSAVPYDGTDPEMAAYARLGIDPELIRGKRADAIQNMSLILMGQGRGVDGSNLGAQLAAAGDESRGINDILKLKSEATKSALERGKLSLLQQKLLSDAASQERLNRLGELGMRMLGGGGGDAGSASGPSLDALAGNSPAPAPQSPTVTGSGVPGGGRVAVSDLPGQNGNPPLQVSGTGAGVAANPELSTAQRAVAAPSPLATTVAAAGQGDPKAAAALGLPADVRKALMLQFMTDPAGAIKAYTTALEKSRYTSTRNDNGAIVSRDQYGNVNVQNAPTQAEMLRLKQGETDISSAATEQAAQANFARERQKAAEDAARNEDIKTREAGMASADKKVTEAYKSAQASKDVLEKTALAEDLMRQGVYNGGAAQVGVGAARAALSRAGLWKDSYAEDQQARTVALQNLGREIAVGVAKSLRPSTDKDVAFAQQIAGLSPEQYDLKTMREVLRISRQGHENTINDYNALADRIRVPYTMSGDARSAAIADANYPKIAIPAGPAPIRKTVGDKTYENDGRGWYEVR